MTMKTLALCLSIAAAGAPAAAGCGRDDASPPATRVEGRDAVRILEGTPWLDKAPERETDVVQLYAFARGEGIYFVGNQYKGSYEAFTWFADATEDGDELRLRFLAENKTYKTRFTIEEVDDRVFDYKLTMAGSPRGPKVYYGFASHRDVPAAVQRLARPLGTP